MPPRKYVLKTGPSHEGTRLDQVLAEWLPEATGKPCSKGQARKLIVAGAIYLNGKRVRIASKELRAGARVEAYVDETKLKTASRELFTLTQAHVLYEDSSLIVVNKPPGLPTQPTLDEARDNLFAAVKRFVAGKHGPGAYVGLHHRLDRDTSGVVLFTRSESVNRAIAEAFSGHAARKSYRAVVQGVPPQDEFVVQNFLGRATDSARKQSRFTAVRSGGDPARTEFKVLERFTGVKGGAALVEARPITGRTHQIRVHLSELGFPIWGDATYGGPLGEAPRMLLHAASLTIPHPISNVILSVDSPLPEDFAPCLARLRASSSRAGIASSTTAR